MWDFSWVALPEAWAVLGLLVFLEVVLGIDNIIFITLVTRGLPPHQQPKAQRWGLLGAAAFRLVLLAGVSYLIHLQTPVFTYGDYVFSWKDLILVAGGIFLLAKSTHEIHRKVAGEAEHEPDRSAAASMGMVILQILVIDAVFSIDSILTAIGLTEYMTIIAVAIVAAVGVMLFFAGVVSRFLQRYPTFQILALSFLILIGVLLLVEGFHYHVPRGYVYFALLFSLMVEVLNIRMQQRRMRRKSPDG